MATGPFTLCARLPGYHVKDGGGGANANEQHLEKLPGQRETERETGVETERARGTGKRAPRCLGEEGAYTRGPCYSARLRAGVAEG